MFHRYPNDGSSTTVHENQSNANSINVSLMTRITRTLEEKQSIVNDYINGLSQLKIRHKYNIHNITVNKILEEFGIQKRTTLSLYSKYTCNEKYFKNIDSPDKAYWLGFIFGDGCISRPTSRSNSNRLTIVQSKLDVEHLEKFKFNTQSTHPIEFIQSSNSVRIRICCQNMAQDLYQWGLIPQKTHNLKFNTFNSFTKHFIRGYFDADGCWYVNSSGRVVWSIVSGDKNFLEDMQKYLILELSLSSTKIWKGKGNYYNLAFSKKKDCQKLFEYFYFDTNLFLERKYLKVVDIFG